MNTRRFQEFRRDAFAGVILGTAVGDALGLPAENMSPRRIHRRWKGEWRMRLLFGRKGMISDDTEHTIMVAQALLANPGDSTAFQRNLGWKLRWWFASLPAGVGLATAKACLKLWFGFPCHRAAVPSAGSGPAMRSAVIGVFFADDQNLRRKFVAASSGLTHRGWQADVAALAVAESTALTTRSQGVPQAEDVVRMLRALSSEGEWQAALARMESSLSAKHSVSEFAMRLGLEEGVTGYSLHVVPVALYAWLRHPNDFRAGMIEVLEAGGDTDTSGAIFGALAGSSIGIGGIPRGWLEGIAEWPRSISFMEKLSAKLSEQVCGEHPLGPVSYFWPGLVLRNIFFLAVILAHGFRRLAPPY